MKIGVLGSGAVGVALTRGLLREGHEVWIATREPESDKAEKLREELDGVTVCDFAQAATHAELAILCVKWVGAKDAVTAAGAENLAGKTVIDTSNVLSPADDGVVYAGHDQSAAEQVQQWLPTSNVIKAFNTVGAATMYQPDFGGMRPTMFVAGNDAAAKNEVRGLAESFGWEVLDAGSLRLARSLEEMAIVWINNSIKSGSPHHAFKML
jgi:8-hydroxy-5-deazaflavin:NADPH oxidoreductase